MAKAKPQSKHSRAARRAASPSLDLDKSLTSLPRAEKTELHRESILADRANAGVSKKQAKPKSKSRMQRLRHQKGMDRAEAVLDQMDIKKAKSIVRAKNVKTRAGEWADLNKKAAQFGTVAGGANDDNDEAMVDASAAPTKSKPQTLLTSAAQTAVVDEHAPLDEDEEIT
ncbi:Alb1-domain-containing protein [Aspergillus californicus]